ncbi:MAG: hypothetical protein AAB631_01100 [Patescibacteria group bacterium]
MENFLRDLQYVFFRARKRWPKMRTGFCFALYGYPSRNLILKGMVGKVRDFKLEKYYELVDEKAKRLFYRGPFHNSSYESREPEAGKYGGAVRGEHYILSISGMAREHEDEAIAMVTLILHKEMNKLFPRGIAEVTGNKIFDPLYEDCRREDHSGD